MAFVGRLSSESGNAQADRFRQTITKTVKFYAHFPFAMHSEDRRGPELKRLDTSAFEDRYSIMLALVIQKGGNMSKIVAVVSVFSTPELLPHFVLHYSKLQIDKLCVSLNCDFDTDILEARYGNLLRIHRMTFDRFTNPYKHAGEEQMLSDEQLQPDDWVMHLDLDEFHVYPAHVRDIVRNAEAQNIWAMTGYLYDRVAAGGILQPVKSDISLDKQFPFGGWLTDSLVGGNTRKVMLCRRRVKLTVGRHNTQNGRIDRWPIGTINNYRVHHFRWTQGLLERLESRWRLRAKKHLFTPRRILRFAEIIGNGDESIWIFHALIKPAQLRYPDMISGMDLPYK